MPLPRDTTCGKKHVSGSWLSGIWLSLWWPTNQTTEVLNPWLFFIQGSIVRIAIFLCCLGVSKLVPKLWKLFRDARAKVPVTAANGNQRTPRETRRQRDISPRQVFTDFFSREHRNQHISNIETEKMRMNFELTMLKHQHKENKRKRQHEEKMEQIRQQLPSRTTGRVEEEQLSANLDPIIEIDLEKIRMEFELAKLKHLSEENERQRQHEQKMCEDKEKQRLHEEKMEQMRQWRGSFLAASQKAQGDAMGGISFVSFSEDGKVRIELQLPMQVFLPELNAEKFLSELRGEQEPPKQQQQVENTQKVGKLQPLPVQKENDGVTEHLGLQVPSIVVRGAEREWSSSRLDLATEKEVENENEVEKRGMEFELTRQKLEHEKNSSNKEKMEACVSWHPSKSQ